MSGDSGYTSEDHGERLLTLKEGELVRFMRNGPIYYVDMVNASRARCIPLNSANAALLEEANRLIEEGNEVEVEFIGKIVNVSPQALAIRVDPGEVGKVSQLEQQEDTMAEVQAAIPVAAKSAKQANVARKAALAEKKAAKPPVKLSGAAAKAKANGKPKAPKVVRPCTCGCSEETTAYFVPGHDARFKSWMVKIERGTMQVAELPKSVQKAFEFKKKGPGFVTTLNYKGEKHTGYDKA